MNEKEKFTEEDLGELPFLQKPLEEQGASLKRNIFILILLYLICAVVLLMPFKSVVLTATIFYVSLALAFIITVILLIKGVDYGQRSIVEGFEYLVIPYEDEHGDKHYKMFCDDSNVDEIACKFGNLSEDEEELYRYKAKHLVDQRIIKNYRKQNDDSKGVFFIIDEGKHLYYSEDEGAILSFNTRDEAEAYMKKNLKGNYAVIAMPIQLMEGDK